MKGVMDFADHGRDDHFQAYAARASAECLLWFLREHLATDPVAGFDDVLTPGTLPLPTGDVPPSMLPAPADRRRPSAPLAGRCTTRQLVTTPPLDREFPVAFRDSW
jgi:hypothetical protein